MALINFEVSIFSAGNERMDSAAKLTSEDWHLNANCANFEQHRDFFIKIYEINQVGIELSAFSLDFSDSISIKLRLSLYAFRNFYNNEINWIHS